MHRLTLAKRKLLAAIEESGVKHDEGKAMIDLLVPEFIEAMAKVMTLGAKKYGTNNWKRNLERRRILAALYRHTIAYHKGETYDRESELNHMAHVGCNSMFLYWYDEVKSTLEAQIMQQVSAGHRKCKRD